MAKIYKFEGYAVAANDENINIKHLLDRYTDGIPFIRTNEYEEFEWNDDLDINHTDDYWEVDKFYCQLGYDRVVRELKEAKFTGDDEPVDVGNIFYVTNNKLRTFGK